MAENSKIEWTDHTQNFWIGCTKVGPPCDNCYAESLSKRYGWATWGPHGERKRTSAANWKKPYQWDRAAERAGVRLRVFSLSLGDWLDNQVPQQWRGEMGNVIDETPHLDWLLLTKRIQNFRRLSPWQKPPRNVWLGITCGDQDEYNRDWPRLRDIDAAVRFISNEPALGALNPFEAPGLVMPDWIIQGGESGAGHRDMPLAWAHSLRGHCAAAGIAYFFKQTAGKKPIPPDLLIRQFPVPRPKEAA